MKHKTLKLSVLSIALTSLLTACGGGGSDSGTGGTTPVAQKGRAVDGPLSGAKVIFADCNNAEATTDATGYFTFPANCPSSVITISGGIDTTTDLPFTGELKAPKSSNTQNQIIVSPITTLIQASVAAGATPAQAAQDVATALNLTGVDLLSADPTTNQAVYAKTVAVQELVEQIAHAVESLGGTVSPADTFASLQSALKASSGSGSTDNLLTTATITAALGNTLEKAKATLPKETADNLTNVKANLASLTASVIAANVESVEKAITVAPASAFATGTGSIDSIKTATQTAVVASKETVATSKIVENLAAVLTKDPTAVSESLKQIGEAVAKNDDQGSATTIASAITAIEQKVGPGVINAENVTAVQNANSFYADYLKLDGFNVQSVNYTPAQLNSSLATPISVTTLNNMLVGVSGVGKYATTNVTPVNVVAILNITAASKTLTITADEVNLEFTAGILTKAQIKKGTALNVTSNLTGSTQTSKLTVDADTNVLSGGKVALNTTTLASLSPSLASQLTKYSLKDDTATVTAVLSTDAQIAILKADNKTPVSASKYTLGTTSGAGISAKFKVTQ